MKSIAIKILVNGAALWVAALVLQDGIRLGEGGEPLSKKLGTIVLVSAVFGLVNAFIKPVLTLFSLPFIILTLGLFTLVINALMLLLTAWIADRVGIAFTVRGFIPALLGSICVSLVGMVLGAVLISDREKSDD